MTTATIGAIAQPLDPVANAQILANCAAVPQTVISYGANLLANGDHNLSVAGVAGPGWATDYTVLGAGGPGQMGFQAALGPDGTACWYVDISTNLNARVFYWTNIFLENGATYQISMALWWSGFAAQMNVAIKINGGAAVATLLGNVSQQWRVANSTFIFTGATGYHTVAVTSNSGAPNGNDGRFDNITLRRVDAAQTEARTPKSYQLTHRAILDQTVEAASCNDDRRDLLLSDGSGNVGQSAKSVTLDSQSIKIGGVAAVTQTMAALLPAGKTYIALGLKVLLGTCNYTDVDGTVVNAVPVGFSARWEAPNDGKLNPLQSITATANSQVAILFLVR